jgi:ribose transport system permease protein
MNKRNIKLEDLMPFIAFIVIFLFFNIASDGKMLKLTNLRTILEQSIVVIIAGTGAMFVAAQGSIDLSLGVNLALSGVIAAEVSNRSGIPVLMIPVALIIGTAVGIFNGVIVSKFKVPSFMVTISLLIGLRGVVNYIQTIVSINFISPSLKMLDAYGIKIPAFLAILVIMYYIFEFTKVGKYSRAIGENETTARFVGVPVIKEKILAFAISGFMAGFAAIFTMTKLGGTSTSMGVFFEMKVAMAIYLGGVLVTGGSSAKMHKLILGALIITAIENGLALIRMSSSQISQSVEGIFLLVILFFTILAHDKKRKAAKQDLSILHIEADDSLKTEEGFQ